MICATVNESTRAVEATAQSIEQCDSYILISASDYSFLNSTLNLTSSDANLAFMFPFSVIMFCWFMGYSVKVIQDLINQI